MSDSTKPKASRMVAWLRSTYNEKATFTVMQAEVGTGYQTQYTSTALTYLIEDGTYGVQRIAMGNYLYDPAFDRGRQPAQPAKAEPRKEDAMNLGTVPDTGLTGRIITYMHQHPNEVRTVPQVAEAIDAIDSSAGNALKRLAARGQAGIVMLARGVFQYQPEPAAEEPAVTQSVSAGPMAGKTRTELRSVPGSNHRSNAAQSEQHKAGDMFELVGSGESGVLVVRSETGKLYKLTEL